MVDVVLELQKVRSRVAGHEGLMYLDHAFEAKAHVAVERNSALLAQVIERVKISLLSKSDTKVTRVHRKLAHRRHDRGSLAQVTDQLVTKEIDGHSIVVASRQLAAELLDVKVNRRVEIVGRYGQVENVLAFSH